MNSKTIDCLNITNKIILDKLVCIENNIKGNQKQINKHFIDQLSVINNKSNTSNSLDKLGSHTLHVIPL